MGKQNTIRTIVLLLLAFSGVGFAQINVVVPDLSAEMGQEISIPIQVSSLAGEGVISYQTRVLFDETILEIKGVTAANTISESWGNPTANMANPGQVSIAGYGTKALTGSGNLVFLNFTVIGQPGATSPVKPGTFLFNNDRPKSAIQSGEFQVTLVPISVTITTDWGGGEVIVDGENHSAPYTTTWYKHQSHTISVAAEILTEPGIRHAFSSWSDDGTREHEVTPVSDASFTANMELQYYLTITSDYGNPQGQGWYVAGNSATIQVDPMDEYESQKRVIFQNWTGSGDGSYSGSENSAVVVMNEPVQQTVTWSQQYFLKINSDFGSPTGAGWYDAGASAAISIDEMVLVENEERHLFSSWNGTGEGSYSGTTRNATVVVNGPIVQQASWENQYFLKTAVSPENGGTITPVPPGDWYDEGARAEVLATPNTSFGFDSWSGDLEGTENSGSVRMSRAKSVTANFGKQLSFTIATEPSGLQIAVDGVNYSTPKMFIWIEGSTHELNVPSPQVIDGNERYVFESWSDTQPQQHKITAMLENTNYFATFSHEYFLTTQISPSGQGTINPPAPGSWYTAGTSATVTATPVSGYVFYEWSGDVSGSQNPVNVNLSRGKIVAANFSPVLAIKTPSLPGGVLNGYYSQAIEVTGGVDPISWRLENGSLPLGLELDPNTGIISGTPAEHGDFNITVRVEDSINPPQSVTRNYAFTIDEFVVLLADNFNDGNFNGWQIVDDGGNYRPSNWFVENGILVQTKETWGGVYDGADPTKPGTYAFWAGQDWQDYEFSAKLRSTDNHAIGVMFRYHDRDNFYQFAMDSKDGYRRLVKNVNGRYQILATESFSYREGTWYDIKAVVKDQNIKIYFNGSVIFNVTDNAIASGGVALYCWKNNGNYFDDVTVQEIQIPPLMVANSSLPAGTAGVAYSASLFATGGTAPYSWSISSGNLPNGLTLNFSTGQISGTPTATGTFHFQIEVTDSDNPAGTARKDLSIVMNPPPPLQITKASLNDGRAYSAYEDILTATGGVAPYSWSVATGSVPTGLNLSATSGTLSGTPTTPGTYNFTARVRDSGFPQTETMKEFFLFIDNIAPVVIKTETLPQGTISKNFSATLEVSGGLPPYSSRVTEGSLPPGLTLNLASGQITGVPTTAGTFDFKVRADDSADPQNYDRKALSIEILNAPPVRLTTTLLPEGMKAQPYSAQLSAESGMAPYTWKIASGSLPAGLSLNSGSGLISGTPSVGGTFSFTVEVSDNATPKTTDSESFALRIDETTILLSDDFEDYNYNGWTIIDDGSLRGPSNWQVNSGVMQQLSNLYGDPRDGTNPDKPGTYAYWYGDWSNYEFKVRLRSDDDDGIGVMFRYQNQRNYYRLAMNQQYNYRRLMKKVNDQNITLAEDNFTYAKGEWYEYRIVVENEKIQVYMTDAHVTDKLIFEVTDNSLASGGVALYSWNNDASNYDNVVVTGIHSGPEVLSITTPNLAAGQVKQNYSATLAANGGTPPFTWSVSSGNLQAGLSLNSGTGQISGTPTAEGSASFTVKVQDSGIPVQEDTQNLSLTIAGIPPLSLTTTSLPAGMAGTSYSTSLTAEGGEPPYTWEISSGNLPDGLSLNSSSGAITGTPVTPGTATFTAKVTDSGSRNSTQSLTLTISSVPPVNIITASLPDGQLDQPYSAQLSAESGMTPYTWKIASGSLPAGLSLNSSSGLISGTPSVGGTFSFTVEVSDNATPKTTDSESFALRIDETTILLSDDFEDYNYNGWTIIDDGSLRGPSNWQVNSGVMQQLSNLYGDPRDGTNPDKPGTYAYWYGDWSNYEFKVRLRSDDDDGIGVMFRYQNQRNYYRLAMNQQYNYRRLMKKVNDQNITLAEDSFTYAKGEWYEYRIVVENDKIQVYMTDAHVTDKLIFEVSDNSLASGGVALYSWNNDASNYDNVVVTGIHSGPEVLSITTSNLATGQVKQNYSATLNASGGTPPFTWSVSSGNLPAGLSLNSGTGQISGTPTTEGTFSFTAKVQDSGIPVQEDTQNLSLTIAGIPPLSLTTTSLPAGMAGASYSASLTAEGGEPPYTWEISSGNLPDGLSLNSSSGAITGTPVTPGTATFTAKVTDSGSRNSTQSLTLTISSVPPVNIITASLPDGQLDQPYSAQLSAESGMAPYTWKIASGSLPAGLSLNSGSGLISGTPSVGGTFSFTVEVSDNATPKTTDSESFTIRIDETTILLSDDFEDYNYTGWTIIDDGGERGPSEWRVDTGMMKQLSNLYGPPKEPTSPDKPGTYAYWPGDWSNYEFKVRLRSDDDDGIGVMFRYQDQSNYYRLAMNQQDSYRRLMKKVDNQNIPLAEDNFTYAKGEWYEYRIVVENEKIQVYMNDAHVTNKLVFEVTDNSHASGGVALYSWNNNMSFYDNVLVNSYRSQPKALEIATTSLPAGQIGTSYSQTLTATGGTTPYQWQITEGALPSGLTLSGSTISGTPGGAGTFNFKVRVSDSGEPVQSATRNLSLTINAAPQLTITTNELASKMLGESYSETLTAINGKQPYQWSIVSGSLPDGLTLNTTSGQISGTSTAAGTFQFTAKVVDISTPQQEGTKALSIVITARPPLKIVTVSLKNGSLDTPYDELIEVTGGLAPYFWEVTSGAIPSGLSLNSADGKMSGTPTKSGTFEFRIRVVDRATPASATEKDFSIVVSQMVNYLTEDFEDGDCAGWTIVDEGSSRAPSKWTVYWNALEQTSDIYDGDRNAVDAAQLGTFAYWHDLSWTDYDATLELRSDDDDALGVMFRYQNADNYYRFSMDNERGYRRLVRRYQGKSVVLASDSYAYVSNRWNQVKIRVIRNSITVFYNGEVVFEATDEMISSGGIALYSWYNAASKFDNISVTTPILGKRKINPDDLTENVMFVPTEFTLYQNYPNPFNPETTINFDLPESGEINLTIYNLLGQPVKTLVAENFTTGRHEIRWNGTDEAGQLLPSGLYIYRIRYQPNQGNQRPRFVTKKMVLMK